MSSSDASQRAAAACASRARRDGRATLGGPKSPNRRAGPMYWPDPHRRRSGGAQDGQGTACRRLPQRGPGHPPEFAAQAAVAEGRTAPRQVAPCPAGVRCEGQRPQSSGM